jgi:hypothetical protein
MGSVHARGDTFLTFGLKALTETNTSRLATGFHSSLMMEAVRTSETSVDNHFTRQYIPEDNSEH